jgi:hypothetical protein
VTVPTVSRGQTPAMAVLDRNELKCLPGKETGTLSDGWKAGSPGHVRGQTPAVAKRDG